MKYNVTLDNNTTREIDGPAGATMEQLQSLLDAPTAPSAPTGGTQSYRIQLDDNTSKVVQGPPNATMEQLQQLIDAPSAASPSRKGQTMTAGEAESSSVLGRFAMGSLPGEAILSAAQFLPSETANKWAAQKLEDRKIGMEKRGTGFDAAGLTGGIASGFGLAGIGAKAALAGRGLAASAGKTLLNPFAQGAIFGVAAPVIDEDPTLKEKAKNVGISTALGGAVGSAASVAGAGLKYVGRSAQDMYRVIGDSEGARKIAEKAIAKALPGELDDAARIFGTSSVDDLTAGQYAKKLQRFGGLTELEKRAASGSTAEHQTFVNKYQGQADAREASIAREIGLTPDGLSAHKSQQTAIFTDAFERAKSGQTSGPIQVGDLVKAIDAKIKTMPSQPEITRSLQDVRKTLVTPISDADIGKQAGAALEQQILSLPKKTFEKGRNAESLSALRSLFGGIERGELTRKDAMASLRELRLTFTGKDALKTGQAAVNALRGPSEVPKTDSQSLVSAWNHLGYLLETGGDDVVAANRAASSILGPMKERLAARIGQKNSLFRETLDGFTNNKKFENQQSVAQALLDKVRDRATGESTGKLFSDASKDDFRGLVTNITGKNQTLHDVFPDSKYTSDVREIAEGLSQQERAALPVNLRGGTQDTAQQVSEDKKLMLLSRANQLANYIKSEFGQSIEPDVQKEIARLLMNKQALGAAMGRQSAEQQSKESFTNLRIARLLSGAVAPAYGTVIQRRKE